VVSVITDVQTRLKPETAEELASALGEANASDQAVAPVGGGSQLDLGMPPTRVDVMLETTRLDRVVEYEPADLTVTVEAGIRFADLQQRLGEHGQFLALDPPAHESATIGGLIATNASGPLRFSSGTARDLVLGTRVANPEGTLTRAGGRVVKNVAGYDLNKLYIGSLGTLGVIVELSFKLAPIPASLATVVGSFAELGRARAAISTVVRSPLSPLAIELLGPNAAAGAGLPADAALLVFRVGGYPQAVERQIRDLSSLIGDHDGATVEPSDSLWDDLAAMRLQAQQRDIMVKAATPISATATLVELLSRRLGQANPFVWAHAGNGVAYAACDSVPADSVRQLRQEVAALGANASLVIQRCPVDLKQTIDVWGDPGSSVMLMRALKAKLDPKNTLNPGRYVGGI
jgi:glycolate oxidase FAD binding subunit